MLREIRSVLGGMMLACVIMVGAMALLGEPNMVRAKNIDGPKSEVHLAPPKQTEATTEAPGTKTSGFTIPAEAMPTGDVYFVTIIKGHGENDGIWVLSRPLSTVAEKAGFTLIMEAAKKGDAKHYPLPDELKPEKK